MKRPILLVATLALSLGAWAQETTTAPTIEYKALTGTEDGNTKDAATKTENPAVTGIMGYLADKYKSAGGNGGKINDQVYQPGIQGATNPAMGAGESIWAANGTQVSGAVWTFKPTTDGTLYFMNKATANKEYAVLVKPKGANTCHAQGFQNNMYANAGSVAAGSKTGVDMNVLHCTFMMNEDYLAAEAFSGHSMFLAAQQPMPCYMDYRLFNETYSAPEAYTIGKVRATTLCFEQTGMWTDKANDWTYKVAGKGGFRNITANDIFTKANDPSTGFIKDDMSLGSATVGETKNAHPVYRRALLEYKDVCIKNPIYTPTTDGQLTDDEKKKADQAKVEITLKDGAGADAKEVKSSLPEIAEFYTTAPSTSQADGTLKTDFSALCEVADSKDDKGVVIKDKDNNTVRCVQMKTGVTGTPIFRWRNTKWTVATTPDYNWTNEEYAEWNTKFPIVATADLASFDDGWGGTVDLSANTNKKLIDLLGGKLKEGGLQTWSYNKEKKAWETAGDKAISQCKVPLGLCDGGTGDAKYFSGNALERDGVSISAPTSNSGTGCFRVRCAAEYTYYIFALGSKITGQGYAYVPDGYVGDVVVLASSSTHTEDDAFDCVLFADHFDKNGYITKIDKTGKPWATFKGADLDPDIAYTQANLGYTAATGTEPSTPGVQGALKTLQELKAEDPNAPIYNLQGQVVGKGYKGIAIQNGKKFLIK